MGNKQNVEDYFLRDLENKEGTMGGQHSNNDSTTEDGNHDVALHIFDSIGIEHGYVLDIGAFSTKASNVIPIMKQYNIPGLLLDGVNKYHDPEIKVEWLTKDNIVSILNKYQCPKELDYISIDVDNMDYWLLKSVLEAGFVSNLLILEFNPIWSASESYVKKYSDGAHKADSDTGYSSNYGASLLAFTKLLNTYGYRLVHVMKQNSHNDPSCNNAFFIQETFDINDEFKNQIDVIETLHPAGFVEAFKQSYNEKKFGTTNTDIIKMILKEKWFIEV